MQVPSRLMRVPFLIPRFLPHVNDEVDPVRHQKSHHDPRHDPRARVARGADPRSPRDGDQGGDPAEQKGEDHEGHQRIRGEGAQETPFTKLPNGQGSPAGGAGNRCIGVQRAADQDAEGMGVEAVVEEMRSKKWEVFARKALDNSEDIDGYLARHMYRITSRVC